MNSMNRLIEIRSQQSDGRLEVVYTDKASPAHQGKRGRVALVDALELVRNGAATWPSEYLEGVEVETASVYTREMLEQLPDVAVMATAEEAGLQAESVAEAIEGLIGYKPKSTGPEPETEEEVSEE